MMLNSILPTQYDNTDKENGTKRPTFNFEELLQHLVPGKEIQFYNNIIIKARKYLQTYLSSKDRRRIETLYFTALDLLLKAQHEQFLPLHFKNIDKQEPTELFNTTKCKKTLETNVRSDATTLEIGDAVTTLARDRSHSASLGFRSQGKFRVDATSCSSDHQRITNKNIQAKLDGNLSTVEEEETTTHNSLRSPTSTSLKMLLQNAKVNETIKYSLLKDIFTTPTKTTDKNHAEILLELQKNDIFVNLEKKDATSCQTREISLIQLEELKSKEETVLLLKNNIKNALMTLHKDSKDRQNLVHSYFEVLKVLNEIKTQIRNIKTNLVQLVETEKGSRRNTFYPQPLCDLKTTSYEQIQSPVQPMEGSLSDNLMSDLLKQDQSTSLLQQNKYEKHSCSNTLHEIHIQGFESDTKISSNLSKKSVIPNQAIQVATYDNKSIGTQSKKYSKNLIQHNSINNEPFDPVNSQMPCLVANMYRKNITDETIKPALEAGDFQQKHQNAKHHSSFVNNQINSLFPKKEAEGIGLDWGTDTPCGNRSQSFDKSVVGSGVHKEDGMANIKEGICSKEVCQYFKPQQSIEHNILENDIGDEDAVKTGQVPTSKHNISYDSLLDELENINNERNNVVYSSFQDSTVDQLKVAPQKDFYDSGVMSDFRESLSKADIDGFTVFQHEKNKNLTKTESDDSKLVKNNFSKYSYNIDDRNPNAVIYSSVSTQTCLDMGTKIEKIGAPALIFNSDKTECNINQRKFEKNKDGDTVVKYQQLDHGSKPNAQLELEVAEEEESKKRENTFPYFCKHGRPSQSMQLPNSKKFKHFIEACNSTVRNKSSSTNDHSNQQSEKKDGPSKYVSYVNTASHHMIDNLYKEFLWRYAIMKDGSNVINKHVNNENALETKIGQFPDHEQKINCEFPFANPIYKKSDKTDQRRLQLEYIINENDTLTNYIEFSRELLDDSKQTILIQDREMLVKDIYVLYNEKDHFNCDSAIVGKHVNKDKSNKNKQCTTYVKSIKRNLCNRTRDYSRNKFVKRYKYIINITANSKTQYENSRDKYRGNAKSFKIIDKNAVTNSNSKCAKPMQKEICDLTKCVGRHENQTPYEYVPVTPSAVTTISNQNNVDTIFTMASNMQSIVHNIIDFSCNVSDNMIFGTGFKNEELQS